MAIEICLPDSFLDGASIHLRENHSCDPNSGPNPDGPGPDPDPPGDTPIEAIPDNFTGMTFQQNTGIQLIQTIVTGDGPITVTNVSPGLSVDKVSGNAGDTFTLSVNTDNLALGTYPGSVTFVDATGDSVTVSGDVTIIERVTGTFTVDKAQWVDTFIIGQSQPPAITLWLTSTIEPAEGDFYNISSTSGTIMATYVSTGTPDGWVVNYPDANTQFTTPGIFTDTLIIRNSKGHVEEVPVTISITAGYVSEPIELGAAGVHWTAGSPGFRQHGVLVNEAYTDIGPSGQRLAIVLFPVAFDAVQPRSPEGQIEIYVDPGSSTAVAALINANVLPTINETAALNRNLITTGLWIGSTVQEFTERVYEHPSGLYKLVVSNTRSKLVANGGPWQAKVAISLYHRASLTDSYQLGNVQYGATTATARKLDISWEYNYAGDGSIAPGVSIESSLF
jgi:hypothetical protein